MIAVIINRTELSVHVNACSELYVDIINKKIASLDKSDIKSFWTLISDISRVVMGDAPLLDIFSSSWNRQHIDADQSPIKEEDGEERDEDQGAEALNQEKNQEEEKEWMWQASLLSLEGSYTVIKHLFSNVSREDPIIYRVLSELIRLCCHSTTISYEGSQLECIQVIYNMDF